MKNSFIKEPISNKQLIDSGMAFTIILLLLSFILKKDIFSKLSVISLLLNMTWPKIFYPFSLLWFGLSHLLSLVSSKIILSIVFFFVVTPISVCRRIFGQDSLLLRQFKKSTNSVMVDRSHKYSPIDLEKPY